MFKSKKPLKILIFGGCVSRDIINFASDQEFKLVDYYARSSLASLGTISINMSEKNLDQISSSFQRRMVKRDMSKSFFDDLKTLEFDILLLDLLVERLDVYEMESGSVLTLSNEFLASGLITTAERSSTKCIKSGTEQHRTLWLKGMERFFAALDEFGLVKRVVVNKVY